ncbi:MAG: hypothetical protein WA081_19355 [Desulfosalsimonadaceae bacterium]
MVGHPHFPSNIDKILESKNKLVGTWERKTESEIEVAKTKLKKSSYSLVMPVGLFIVSLMGSCFLLNAIGKLNLLYCLLFSIVISFASLFLQIYKGRSLVSSSSFMVCNKCFTEDRLGLKQCYCGGDYEPQEFYNFIEKGK